MNIFRKVFHPKHKNEISFEANAYIKARNIRVGVLEPNVKNLLIGFCPENVENLYGPYKIFTDIVQENENTFVFLIGLLKNDKLVHLIPKNVDNDGDHNSNSVQFSTRDDNHEINQQSATPKNEQSTSFWERLSKPPTRRLEHLNKRKSSKIHPEELILMIDGNFMRQRMIHKNKKCNGQTIIKILDDKNMNLNKIPWKYYTVSDAYLQGSRSYSIDENNSLCSLDYAESTHVSLHVTSEEEKTSNLANGDDLNNCLSDMKKVMTGFIVQELSPIEKKYSEINPCDENSLINKSSIESEIKEESENIDCITRSPKIDKNLVLNQENCHFIIEKSDLTSTKELINQDTYTLATIQENSESVITSDNLQTNDILISKQESINNEKVITEEINDAKSSDQALTQTLYVFTESPQLSEQDNDDNNCHQNLHKVYENISEKKMEEIILTLIRNANMPVSIDILTKNNISLNKSIQNLKDEQNELSNVEEISCGGQTVLDIEVERIPGKIQEKPMDLSLPVTKIHQDSQSNVENVSCGVQPMSDIEINYQLSHRNKQDLSTNNNIKHNSSDSPLSSIDMEYLDVILNSICDSREKMSMNISFSESSSSSLTTDTYVKDVISKEKLLEPKLQVEEDVNVLSGNESKEGGTTLEGRTVESPINSCNNNDLGLTYVLTPKVFSIDTPVISIIEGTEDIAKLAEEIVKRFQIDDTLSAKEINDRISEVLHKNAYDLTKSPLENDNTLYITANEENESLDKTFSESDLNLPLVNMINKTNCQERSKMHQENWTQTDDLDIQMNDAKENKDDTENIQSLENNSVSGDFQTVFNSVAVPKEWENVVSIQNSEENIDNLTYSISSNGDDNVLSISDNGEDVRDSLNVCDIIRESEKLLESVKEDINKPSEEPPWWIRLSLPENTKKCKSIDDKTYRIKVSQSLASTTQRSNVSSRISYQVRPKSLSDKERETQEVKETVVKKVPRSKFVVSDRLIRLSQPKVKRSPKKTKILNK